jgi:hypothetical protein
MYFKSKRTDPQAFVCNIFFRGRDTNVFADISPAKSDAHVSYDSPRRWQERPAHVVKYRAYDNEEGYPVTATGWEEDSLKSLVLQAWVRDQKAIKDRVWA